jgi:toxin ParE1/3/4
MRRQIEASRAALADLDRIYDYVARDNLRAAADLLRELDSSIKLLADQPKLGRKYPYRRLRLLLHGNYLIFYRERPGTIEIVRVIDGRRNIPDILDEI